MAASARSMILTLLGARAPGATVCPSEVARAISSKESWQDAMPAVHAAVDQLLTEGLVRLTWKGHSLTTRAGPYRIGREITC